MRQIREVISSRPARRPAVTGRLLSLCAPDPGSPLGRMPLTSPNRSDWQIRLYMPAAAASSVQKPQLQPGSARSHGCRRAAANGAVRRTDWCWYPPRGRRPRRDTCRHGGRRHVTQGGASEQTRYWVKAQVGRKMIITYSSVKLFSDAL